MQTLFESICNPVVSAVGCCLGAYIGLSIHNELSRRKRLKEGKTKPLQPVKKLDGLVKEDLGENPIAFFSASNYRRWLAKWGFKKNLNMLQLMQYKLDEYQGDYSCLLKHLVYARPAANEYLVTIHGKYVFVDINTLSKMEADFYADKISPNAHLFAIPKDWVDDIVNKHPELILTDVEEDTQCEEEQSK